MIKVVLVGGGTGGHIYPALAIAEALEEADLKNQILFIGSRGGLEERILERERYSFKTVAAMALERRFVFKIFYLPIISLLGFFQALKILKSYKPNIIVSTGGYVSLPVVFASLFLRIPIVIHEGNSIPGIANRIAKFFASKITVSFEECRRFFPKRKTVVTGGPVRRRIRDGVKSIALQKLNLDQGRKTILIVGGSQGARSLNEAITKIVDRLKDEGIQIIHITGERDYDFVLSQTENKVLNIEKEILYLRGMKRKVYIEKYKMYHPIPYMYNIWDGLAASDLVISRAGGVAISEIITRGLPSILIPYPYASEGHQGKNAEILKKGGAAIILKNDELSGEVLLNLIRNLFKDREKLKQMCGASKLISKPDASRKIVEIIYNILKVELGVKKKKKWAK